MIATSTWKFYRGYSCRLPNCTWVVYVFRDFQKHLLVSATVTMFPRGSDGHIPKWSLLAFKHQQVLCFDHILSGVDGFPNCAVWIYLKGIWNLMSFWKMIMLGVFLHVPPILGRHMFKLELVEEDKDGEWQWCSSCFRYGYILFSTAWWYADCKSSKTYRSVPKWSVLGNLYLHIGQLGNDTHRPIFHDEFEASEQLWHLSHGLLKRVVNDWNDIDQMNRGDQF